MPQNRDAQSAQQFYINLYRIIRLCMTALIAFLPPTGLGFQLFAALRAASSYCASDNIRSYTFC